MPSPAPTRAPTAAAIAPAPAAARTTALPATPQATPRGSAPGTPSAGTSIPGDSALFGEWRFRAETGDRDIEGVLQFRREEGRLVGVYVSPNGSATLLSNLAVQGNRISWDLVTPRTTWHLRGTFSESWMNGTFQTTTRTVQWTATKSEGAPVPTPGA